MVGFGGTGCITWGLAALRCGPGEGFYCRHEEEHSQRHPKESRAGRERGEEGAGEEEKRKEEEKAKREGPKNQGYIGWRSWGKGSRCTGEV